MPVDCRRAPNSTSAEGGNLHIVRQVTADKQRGFSAEICDIATVSVDEC
jgi:hypothetical protein